MSYCYFGIRNVKLKLIGQRRILYTFKQIGIILMGMKHLQCYCMMKLKNFAVQFFHFRLHNKKPYRCKTPLDYSHQHFCQGTTKEVNLRNTIIMLGLILLRNSILNKSLRLISSNKIYQAFKSNKMQYINNFR